MPMSRRSIGGGFYVFLFKGIVIRVWEGLDCKGIIKIIKVT